MGVLNRTEVDRQTIVCTWEEFKRMTKEFHEALPTLNLEELENAWKCLGLGYIGMSDESCKHSTAALIKMECRSYLQRMTELMMQTQGN